MDVLSPSAVDPADIAALLDLCFGPARHRRTAALLRAGAPRIEEASFIMLDGPVLVGSVEAHRLELRGPRRAQVVALVGPLVSHPDRRGERIGTRLMDVALAELDKLALPAVLIGDAPYYARWGFSAARTRAWELPGPVDRARLLLRARPGQVTAGPARLIAPGAAADAA